MKLKLAHIINPYTSPDIEGKKVQDLTLNSMVNAAAFSKNAVVKLYAAIHKNDTLDLDEAFIRTTSIDRTVNDIATFSKKIPLSLIEDIIDKAKNIECDYLIYTNMDIVLQPFFYDYVASELEKGYEALLINRRRVSLKYLNKAALPEILADPGKYHPGYDCFVIKKEYLQKFILKDICVGIPFIGVSMAHNIFSFVHPYKIIDHHNLTAHVGLQVMGGRNKQYFQHNYSAFKKIKTQLKPYLKKEFLPYSELPLWRKVVVWGLNPSLPIAMNMEIEVKGFFNKLYFIWNELRFKILEKVSSSN